MPLTPPISILIVDDEADLRNLLVEALEDQGYAAEGAEGGTQALARVREKHFPVTIERDLFTAEVLIDVEASAVI